MVDIRVYLVVEGVGGHTEEVGDGVVHMGADGVDGVADAEVVELRDAEGSFGPRLAVVEVADMVATAPTDVVQSRVLADDPQHLVPPRAIEGILLHREELRIVVVVTIEEGGLQLKRLTAEGVDGGHLLLQRAVVFVQLLRQRQQPLVDHLEASHLCPNSHQMALQYAGYNPRNPAAACAAGRCCLSLFAYLSVFFRLQK